MPLAVYPDILAGQDLTAALLSGQEWTAWKSGDTPRASATALTADPDLAVLLPADSVWDFDFSLVYEAAHPAGDLNIQWSLPAGASLAWTALYFPQSATVGVGNLTMNPLTTSTVLALAGAGAGTPVAAAGTGLLTIAAASGTFALTWAQFASSATAAIMKAGSKFELRRTGGT